MSRLWLADHSRDAFSVLKTVEALEHIPMIVAVLFGAAAIWLQGSPTETIIAIIAGHGTGLVATMLVPQLTTPLLKPALMLSYISGYGIVLALEVAAVYLARGWPYVKAWLWGLVLSYFLSRWVLEPIRVAYIVRKAGTAMTQAEQNFFVAYRMHASKLGVTQSIEVREDELEEGGWQRCQDDYVLKYPAAAARMI